MKGCGGEDRGTGEQRDTRKERDRGRDGIQEGPWLPVAPVMAMRRGILEESRVNCK